MSDIKYVCISDLHLGEEDSLLTNLKTASFETDLSKPSPVLETFSLCLNDIIGKNSVPDKPTLILCGDILELALAETNEAIMAFQRFIELVMPKGNELFSNIIYIPGNHDHHLWEVARETQYVNNYLTNKNTDEVLDKPWHTTNMFVEEKTDRVLPHEMVLTSVIQRYSHLKTFEIKAGYPNYGIVAKDNKRAVIFFHGHFIEPLYQLMTELINLLFPTRLQPENIWDIEAENYAWIDFFWSALGRSGNVGEGIERIYERLGDEKKFKEMLNTLAKSLAKKYDLPGWGDVMEEKIASLVLNLVANSLGKRERVKTDQPLSDSSEKGLWSHVNGPLYKQILSERNALPEELTLVFGHTHKPFQEDMNFKNYNGWVNVYNTGGWIVETTKPEPIHGGSVVLVDENLNTACLRMYNEGEKPKDYEVKVMEALHPGESNGTFCQELEKKIDTKTKPWKEFSDQVQRARNVRAQNLRARINES